ncbi:MAG: PilZ domain-containing protein [Pseudorhodoplanes sp.]|nr:PilZ domain-containing protein [Pseudorhodoplanes sp.]
MSENDRHERRSELRMAADKKVKVILVDGGVVCLGTLLDLSLLGARILVPLRIEAGKKIDLIFDEQQQRHPSTVVWNTETEIGISFDTQVPVAPAS